MSLQFLTWGFLALENVLFPSYTWLKYLEAWCKIKLSSQKMHLPSRAISIFLVYPHLRIFFHKFLNRRGGGEKGETSIACLPQGPDQSGELNLQPKYVPLSGNWTQDPSALGPVLRLLSQTNRAKAISLFDTKWKWVKFLLYRPSLFIFQNIHLELAAN